MSDIASWTVLEPYLEIGGQLLEGPAYDPRCNQLRWVDIALDKIYTLDLSQGSKTLRTFSVKGHTVATLANIHESDDLLLVGAKYGLATFDTKSGEISYYCKYFDDDDQPNTSQQRFRANDGAVDARGRILQGILLDDRLEKPKAEGMLLSIDIDGQVHRVVENVTTPNGLGWNAANTIMYWAESFSGHVYTFDYDIETGQATRQRVFFHLDGQDNVNVPDGLVVDEEDHVWLAIWGGSAVVRISPEGQIVGKVELPTRFVTCPVFVGTDLYITTAAERDPKNHVESAASGGHLYKVNVGVRGLPKYSGHLPKGLDQKAKISFK